MPLQDVIILGAGPSGMAAAIALSKMSASNPLHITLVEVRAKLSTIGGTINMTPLAMRYLDYLGAGARLRARTIDLESGVDFVSLRTGKKLGNFWGGIGSRRSKRQDLVESLLETIETEHPGTIKIQWGRRVTHISENDQKVVLKFDDNTKMSGDVLLGCDGIHSVTRTLWVDPERQDIFTGRVAAMGYGTVNDADYPLSPIFLATGESALRDTTIITRPNSTLMATYYEPTRATICFGCAMIKKQPDGDTRDGWRLLGSNKEALKNEIMHLYEAGRIKGLKEFIVKCDDWSLYPVYALTGGGRWSRGKVLLMGDAAHAMPPQGESTGLAIEDGILLAHVFQRRDSRTVEQLLSDFETLRKPSIDNAYEHATWLFEKSINETTPLKAMFMEWVIWLYILYKKQFQEDHFAGDVRNLELPP